MKKTLSISLAAVLAFSAVPAAFADTASSETVAKATASEKAADKNNKDVKKGDSSADLSIEAAVDTKAEASAKASGVKEAVKTKKELITLRQELKKANEITDELKEKYEKLVSSLEETSELSQAIEVQKELLERTYKLGEHKSFEKLGELYEKANVKGIKAFINGEEPKFDQEPFIQGGRALVPIRAISSALKADVKWDDKTRSVVITKAQDSITLYLDKKEALVNGEKIELDAIPVLKNGRVFLPLRFVSEQLKANVDWQAKGQIVIIDDQKKQTETETSAAATTATTTTTETTKQ